MSQANLGFKPEEWRNTLKGDELAELASLETAAAATKVAYESLMKRRAVIQRRGQARLQWRREKK